MALRRTNLPALRPPYDTHNEYNAITVGTPRVQEIVSVPYASDIPARVENLEARLQNQELNTQVNILIIITFTSTQNIYR